MACNKRTQMESNHLTAFCGLSCTFGDLVVEIINELTALETSV